MKHLMARSFTIARGKLSEKSKCWMPGAHRCKRPAKWFVFPRGEGTLDTTQFSNLHASPCDEHLLKAIKRVEDLKSPAKAKG